jgi:hypothetical protein
LFLAESLAVLVYLLALIFTEVGLDGRGEDLARFGIPAERLQIAILEAVCARIE